MISLLVIHDLGGSVIERIFQIVEMTKSNQSVIIDGICVSACTLYLHLPPDQICATERATLGFHQATDPETTKQIMELYPQNIQYWIQKKGGLTTRPIYLTGSELKNYVNPCQLSQ